MLKVYNAKKSRGRRHHTLAEGGDAFFARPPDEAQAKRTLGCGVSSLCFPLWTLRLSQVRYLPFSKMYYCTWSILQPNEMYAVSYHLQYGSCAITRCLYIIIMHLPTFTYIQWRICMELRCHLWLFYHLFLF